MTTMETLSATRFREQMAQMYLPSDLNANLELAMCDDIRHPVYLSAAAKVEQPNSSERPLSLIFNLEQVSCLCKTLYLTKDGDCLTRLFESDPYLLNYEHNSNSVLLAVCYCLFHNGKYEDLFKKIEDVRIDEAYHKELQNLWYEAHYALEQQKKPKKLGPVEKYRLRGKFKPPQSIWDGEKVVYNFKEGVRKKLIHYYQRNKYPKPEEKQQIALETSLSPQQIANWFKNRRQRDKPARPSCELVLQQQNAHLYRPIEPYYLAQ